MNNNDARQLVGMGNTIQHQADPALAALEASLEQLRWRRDNARDLLADLRASIGTARSSDEVERDWLTELENVASQMHGYASHVRDQATRLADYALELQSEAVARQVRRG